MAWDRLSSYHRVDEIYDHDVEDEPRVYQFFKTISGPVRYVGRSGSSLYNRIRGREYVYYRYKHCYDDEEAYYWECEYYHRYEDTIDNWNHPAKPSYSNSQCHICDS